MSAQAAKKRIASLLRYASWCDAESGSPWAYENAESARREAAEIERKLEDAKKRRIQ